MLLNFKLILTFILILIISEIIYYMKSKIKKTNSSVQIVWKSKQKEVNVQNNKTRPRAESKVKKSEQKLILKHKGLSQSQLILNGKLQWKNLLEKNNSRTLEMNTQRNYMTNSINFNKRKDSVNLNKNSKKKDKKQLEQKQSQEKLDINKYNTQQYKILPLDSLNNQKQDVVGENKVFQKLLNYQPNKEQLQQKCKLQSKNKQFNGDAFMRQMLDFSISKIANSTNFIAHSDTKQEYFKNNVIKIEPKQQKAEQKISSLWLGSVYDKCTSTAFKNYICRNLDYNQAKAYCCEQILSNILTQIHQQKKISDFKQSSKMNQSITINTVSSDKKSRKKIIYETKTVKFINQQSDKILAYLCHKYPQMNISGVNKKVSQVIQTMNIDNWANDQYDILRLTGVKFVQNQSKEYSQQIMRVLNFLIAFPHEKHRKYQNLTNFKYFQKVMSKIFSIIYTRDSKNDVSKIINSKGQIDIDIKKKQSITQQDLQYQKKVKQYTSILIGSKISNTTKIYSDDIINSGIIKVDNNAVARVIDKWAQELGSKFFQAEKHILNRTYRFKSFDGTKFNKIQTEQKQVLFNILCDKKKELQQFISQLKQSAYDLTLKLASSQSSDVSSLTFISQRQRMVGQFAVKMSQSNSQYFIQILKKQISLLVQSVQILKQKWVQKHKFKQSPFYQALNINLITLKIGDLLRCKITSNQQQIIRVLKLLKLLNQKFEGKIIKIIRVKNRLESGTRDVLINFLFDQSFPCEIQLAVAQKTSQKQQYFDKFNHFLYQLKRSFLGPLMQMCKIWNQYESKSQTFIKQIQKSTKNKIKPKRISQELKNMQFQADSQIYQYKFPFVCHSCLAFCPRSELIYFNTLVGGKIYCANCNKIKLKLLKNIMEKKTVQYIFRKYIIRYPNFYRLVDKLYQANNFNQVIKNKFQIHVPLQSRLIHMNFSMILKLQKKYEGSDYDQYAFVSTLINQQGQLKKQVCREKVSKLQKGMSKTLSGISLQRMQQLFNDQYLIYNWDFNTKMIPLPDLPNNHYYELINNLLPRIRKLQQIKGPENVKVGAIQLQENRYYFIPFFLVDEVQITEQLKQQHNTQNIISCLKRKEEILQIQNCKITTQLHQLSLEYRSIISNTITEIYLPKNNMKDGNFIKNLRVLKIFDVAYNQIQQIPEIPKQLEQLRLQFNKIKKINSFIIQQQAHQYKIKLLDLAFNSEIEKFQNIQKLTNLKSVFLVRSSIQKIEGLPESVQSIGLGFNKISKIENISHLKKLTKLNLAQNQITKIQNLQHCTNLEILMLNRNKIHKIQNIDELQNLTVLHLNGTGLQCDFQSKGSLHILKGLRKIKRLLVQDNKIVCLLHLMGLYSASEAQKINPLTEMQQIIASNNDLHTICSLQRGFPWLKILNVDKNKITQIDNIVNLNLLQQFSASNNLIARLPSAGWERIFKLKSINLSNNQIRVVPNLKPLIFIKNLNLQSNRIRQVQAFPGFPVGTPDLSRTINLNKNQLFHQDTTQDELEKTLNAIKQLNLQSSVFMLDNGNSLVKLDQVNQIKQNYQLKNLSVQASFL